MEPAIKSDYLNSLRPKQWAKNLLVAAAPLAAGFIQEKFFTILLGIFAFSLASSIGYLVNDWRDRKFDQLHPFKKGRPFASGALGLPDFIVLLIVCVLLTVYIVQLLPPSFTIALLAYLALTILYSLFVKNYPTFEIIWLALGFLVRALAGSTLIGEPPSSWFVISIYFGSIFIVSSKRLAEKTAEHKFVTRIVLKSYSVNFLVNILSAAMSVTLITYSLWVFEIHSNSIVAQFSIIPFSLLLFTYANMAEKSHGESPEELFLRNIPLVLISFLTLASIVWTTYFE